MKEYRRLLVMLGVLVILLGGFLLYLSWPSLTGRTIILTLAPRDPFDPLRGQYMTLRYEISTIPPIEMSGVPPISDAIEGDAIYVILKEDEKGVWRYEQATKTKPRNGMFIRGKIKSVGDGRMSVEYGIEQYFFERNARLPTNDISIEVKVSSSGQARIVRLLQDGKPIDIEYQNVSLTS